MKVLFVAHGDFFSNSSVHIFGFANQLVRLGFQCAVAVPHGKDTVKNIGDPLFKVFNFDEFKESAFEPDLIHCWTPREHVRLFSEPIRKRHNCKLIVHLEDNEEFITARLSRTPIETLKALNPEQITARVPAQLSHPLNYQHFLKSADAITVITDNLADLLPEQKPFHVLWPGVDFNLFNPEVEVSKHAAMQSVPDSAHLIAYTGNVHAANAPDVLNLYLAIELLNRNGISTRILRTGADHVDFTSSCPALKKNEISLGVINWREIPGVLASADLLIQPGRDDTFNRYRLPSKLPEYLAMGKPVMLPYSNIGKHLIDGHNAVILHTGLPNEISAAASVLLKTPELGRKIGENGRMFARNAFDLKNNTESLVNFYKSIFNNTYLNKISNNSNPIISNDSDSANEYIQSSKLVAIKWQAAMEAETTALTTARREIKDELSETALQLQNLRHSFYGRVIRLVLRAESTGLLKTFVWMIGRCLGNGVALKNDPFDKIARLNAKINEDRNP